MGGPSSPSVFHTTPPQPALKARTTLYSLSVGGAEASQNGLGDLMPANSLRRSAIRILLLSIPLQLLSSLPLMGRVRPKGGGGAALQSHQHLVHRHRRALAVLDGGN